MRLFVPLTAIQLIQVSTAMRGSFMESSEESRGYMCSDLFTLLYARDTALAEIYLNVL